VTPKISEGAESELISAYVEMRKQGTSSKTITATPRQLESLIRISEALAKMEFSETVDVRHVKEAVRLMHVATKRAALDPVTGLIDMDMLTTGRS
jgi:DNA replication licensing factor MCM4